MRYALIFAAVAVSGCVNVYGPLPMEGPPCGPCGQVFAPPAPIGRSGSFGPIPAAALSVPRLERPIPIELEVAPEAEPETVPPSGGGNRARKLFAMGE